ncbi:MAG: SUMF1/EgtB/PvdO family nonheme iron enzyme [Hylemonella sp.]|nr:SUMF1/EgtB/PvdO family nonheme iron enzyme [Hylemonella sp.]MDH5708932.1 SUMF1/EgtB/PvdO family nonheme iron enzyme [Hylemonella sp.]
MSFELPLSSFGYVDSADLRTAGREMLSLSLMDARNHTLYLIGQYEQTLGIYGMRVPLIPELNPPLWELGHVGWFQERWISRNLQRERGPACDPQATLLSSILPGADLWWDSTRVAHDNRWVLELPSLDEIRTYLLETLESTLELLVKAPDDDQALYFYRLALFHEDMHSEAFIYMAQTLGLPLSMSLPPAVAARAPLSVPACRWRLGCDDGEGFSFDNERPAHEVEVPGFEIDAQPVSWAQYAEFMADGGYERPELWHPEGWAWQQQREAAQGQAPRHVERMGAASGGAEHPVLLRWMGGFYRVSGEQPAMHLSWWEADAWCRWAGRRLPSEVEWEVAAHTVARRGFRWGDVWEWTATPFAGYPGFSADPYRDYSEPWFGSHKVLRGASFATRARLKSPKFRNYYLPERNDTFSGFRTCAV